MVWGFLSVIGFLLMGARCLMGGDTLWPMLAALPLVFAHVLQSNRLLWLGGAIFVVTRVVADGGFAPADAVFAAGAVLSTLAINARCPRCRLSMAAGVRGAAMSRSGYCPGCGRTQSGVWPLQYRLRPETWDGVYHDEGGGPEPDGYWADWMRHRLLEAWRRRTR